MLNSSYCGLDPTRPTGGNAKRTGECMSALVISLLLTACSPYVYKEEINRFATGVGDLADAYQSGLIAGRADERDHHRWNRVGSRARLAVTEDCVPQLLPTASDQSSCSLREVGRPPPPGSRTLDVAAQAAPIVVSL